MSIDPRAIASELAEHNALRRDLLAALPDIDDETLSDTLEGASDLIDLLLRLVRSALEDETLAGALGTRLDDMKAREARLRARARKKRDLVIWAMRAAELPRLLAPDFTASLSKGAATLDVLSEDLIPADYWQPQQPKLDRRSLLAVLKAGTSIAGARLLPGTPHLTVRTR